MKKFLIAIVFAMMCQLSSWAYTLSSDMVFAADGVTLQMNSNGTCRIISRETENLYGTYDIDPTRQVEPGCSNVKIVFNFNGIITYGTFAWPLQDNLICFFENVLLKKVES